MTTKEIAELTGKRHDSVLVDARNILTELHGDALRFEAIYRDSMNREKPCYALPDFTDEVAAARAWADEAGCSERPRVPLSCA